MKNLLLSTSLIVASAGFASAEVTLTGDARMGIFNDFVVGAGDDTVFSSRARVTFTMTGSTDSGLEFGASFRADNAGGAASGTAGSVYVSGAFGKLSMGDVDGAAQSAVGQVDGVGYTGLGDTNEIGYIGAGGTSPIYLDFAFFDGGAGAGFGPMNADPTVLYEYSAGALTVYASVSQLGYSWDEDATPGTWDDAKSMAIGAAYSMDAYKFSIGYERWDGTRDLTTDAKVDNIVLGADATFGAFTAKARYSEGGSTYAGVAFQDHKQWAVSGTYTMDALGVTGFVSEKQFTSAASGANIFKAEAMGIGASYDLGGGAAVKGGVVSLKETTGAAPAVKDTGFDLGLTFSF